MYKFSRTIDGKTIEPLDDGVTQIQSLPDFTEESKYIRITLGANTEHSITLPTNAVGFEIDTDLDDIVMNVNLASYTFIANKVTATTITESNFSSGMIAPQDRRSFTVGNNKTIYMRSATGGDVNLHTF
tara:strand:+ start:244 stop:630 length:387 start_codon:yes stop_codon:yes gene_type:complete